MFWYFMFDWFVLGKTISKGTSATRAREIEPTFIKTSLVVFGIDLVI